MKPLFFTLLFSFLYGCSNIPKDLEGIWIGSYYGTKSKTSDSILIYGPIISFYEISNDSIHFKEFESIYQDNIDAVMSYPCTFDNNVLYFNNDSLVYETISSDSLVVINNADKEYRQVYKKVTINKSDDVNFSNDLYTVEIANWRDTLQFLENQRF